MNCFTGQRTQLLLQKYQEKRKTGKPLQMTETDNDLKDNMKTLDSNSNKGTIKRLLKDKWSNQTIY